MKKILKRSISSGATFRRTVSCMIAVFIGVLSVQAQSLEELKQLYKTAKEDTVRLKLLSDMHWEALSVSLKEAEGYAKEEIRLAEEKKLPRWIAQGYNDLGISQQKEMLYLLAIRSHQKALKIRTDLGEPDAIGSSLSKIGICYSEIDSLQKALNVQLQALVCFRKSGSKRHIAYTLNNICFIYDHQKQFSLLKNVVEEAYALNKELGDDFGMQGSLNYLSSLDEERKDYPAALLKQKEALAIAERREDPLEIGACLNNIGLIYSRMNQREKALLYYRQALEKVEKSTDYNSIILYSTNIANQLALKNQNSEAMAILRKAVQISQAQNLSLHLPQVFLVMGDVFTSLGNTDSANKYYHAYTNALRSEFSDKVAKQMSSIQNQYEIDIREQQKKILSQEIELKETTLGRFQWLTVALILGLISVVSVFMMLRNRQKSRQKEQLNAERLAQQELRTKAIIEAEEKERVRIAKELHDGLGQQLSAAKMNIAGLRSRILTGQEGQMELLENAVALVDDAVKEVRSVSHDMMANALIRNGLASAVRDFVHRLGAAGTIRTELEIVGLNDRLDPGIEMMLYRVLQELVNNILKHARANLVSIQLIRHEDSIVLQVEDNGLGFDAQAMEKSDGIGMANIRSRVGLVNGSFFIDSQPGHGTTATIEVPTSGA